MHVQRRTTVVCGGRLAFRTFSKDRQARAEPPQSQWTSTRSFVSVVRLLVPLASFRSSVARPTLISLTATQSRTTATAVSQWQ